MAWSADVLVRMAPERDVLVRMAYFCLDGLGSKCLSTLTSRGSCDR